MFLDDAVCCDYCVLLSEPSPFFTLYSKAKLAVSLVSLDFLVLHPSLL